MIKLKSLLTESGMQRVITLYFETKWGPKLQNLLIKYKGNFPFNPWGEKRINYKIMKKDGYLAWTIPKYGTDEAKKFFKKQGIKIKKIK